MPTVSFVVPARDEVDALPDLLESIEAQTADVPFEVVIVDDGSTDGTGAVAERFAERADVDVTVVESDGRGPGGARNEGARVAEGQWYAFVDADTCLETDYLAEMHAFVTDEDLDAAGCHCHYHGDNGWIDRVGPLFVNHLCMSSVRLMLPGFNIFVRADAFEAVDGFPEVPLADTAFSKEMREYGDVDVLKERLVSTSSRRTEQSGVAGAAVYYVRRWLQQKVRY